MAEKTATKEKKSAEKKTAKAPTGKYIYAVGRRKTSNAQVRLYGGGKGVITINGRSMDDYVPTKELRDLILSPLAQFNMEKKTDVTVVVKGGGSTGQAEAIRHGIARAMEKKDPEMRKSLKVEGFLTRDARKKERKKPGLKRARRAPQWSKR